MNPLGSAASDDEWRAERALRALASVVGAAPSYAMLAGPVLMPMHLAIDSLPFAVASEGAPPAFFLKLISDDGIDRFDHPATVDASRKAAALGLAPQFLADDPANGALLYELLAAPDWRMALRPDLDDQTVRAAMLAAKRNWHASGLLARTRSPFETIALHREALRRLRADRAGSGPGWVAPQGFHTLVDWVERVEQAFNAAGTDLAPTHGEPATSNLMLGPRGAVKLVDFDRAVNADPHYDLAGSCIESCSFDTEVAEMVQLYLGKRDAAITARVQLYMVVDDFLWGCWALVAHYRTRRNSIEFYKYARNRFVRCAFWLARWDIAALLRRI
ncbi:MAG: hypothetical protein QM674_12315 [Burkholderiaceae bacterium]